MHVKRISKLDFLYKNGVCLHASSVSVSGQALVFLGHSTSGKSTIRQLLSKHFLSIADDKIFVYKSRKGKWMICDATDNCHCCFEDDHSIVLKEYPLLSFLRIFKSKNTHISPISKMETCKYLMDAIFECDFQRYSDDILKKKHWFKLAAEMSRQVEGGRLTFPKNNIIIKIIMDSYSRCLPKVVGKVEVIPKWKIRKNERKR
jgi:energy-coupling factor transporter ATP-binding protein EcfA2